MTDPSSGANPIRHIVEPPEVGKTLAAVVRTLLGAIPWSRARDLVASGRVHVDGKPVVDEVARMTLGAVVEVRASGVARSRLHADGFGPESLLHLDNDVGVVRKPAGLLTVPTDAGERDTLVERVRTELGYGPLRGVKRDAIELGVVHRLDRDTSGLLVLARNFAAKRELSEQFRVHSVERVYLAIVHGVAVTRTYETMFVRDRGDGLRGSIPTAGPSVARVPEDAVRAVTHVEALQVFEAHKGREAAADTAATLVRYRLETGRQHQIRIHLSEAGTPVVGEEVYVRDVRRRTHAGLDTNFGVTRQMLHATILAFDHPRGTGRLRFEDPPPEDFAALLSRLRPRVLGAPR